MNDLATWSVRGPVRTLRQEHATWDASQSAWQAPRGISIITFRLDGQASERESHNPDGSATRSTYLYDDEGRVARQEFWNGEAARTTVVYSYDASGRLATVEDVALDGTRRVNETCRYDEVGRRTTTIFLPPLPPDTPMAVSVGVGGLENRAASEVAIHDADGRLVWRVVFSRDEQGRVVTEVVHAVTENLFSRAQPQAGHLPADVLAAVMERTVADEVFSKTEYTYDVKGRLTEKTMSMGILSDEHWTFQYDDHDNLIAETTIRRSREVTTDDHGVVRSSKEEPVVQQHNQFSYQYDSRGNWTERVVSYRLGSRTAFQRSNIERRTITYYEP
jgi:hypothetical protein